MPAMRIRHLLLATAVLLPLAGCGDSMSRGLVITGDGKVGANNARNQRENAQDALRSAIIEDLGEEWTAKVVIKEQPIWVEERGSDDGLWRWERITATVDVTPPAGAQLEIAKRDELESGAREYFMRKLAKKDPALIDLTMRIGAASAAAMTVAAPVAQAAGQRTYVVQPGDTLADISLAFYGSAQHWRRIADANPGGSEAGKTIVIPAAAAQAAPAPAAP